MKRLMRACVINEFGDRDKLMITELAEPDLLDGEVLIKIKASGVNPVDVQIRQGFCKNLLPYRFPLILGWEMSGIIVNTSYSVKRFKPGDEVYACCRRPVIQYGTYADYISLPESYITRRPLNISFCDAAAIPLAGLTAYQALYELGQLRAGAEVFILGAAGGVGSFAVQFARLAGAHVSALAKKEHHNYLRMLGADETIDYTETDFRIPFRHLIPRGADLIIDCVGHEILARAYYCLKSGGTLVSLLDQEGDINLIKSMAINYYYHFVEPNAMQLDQICQLVEKEELKVYLDSIFSLAEVAAAHERIESGRTRGKIVLEL